MSYCTEDLSHFTGGKCCQRVVSYCTEYLSHFTGGKCYQEIGELLHRIPQSFYWW